MRIVTPESFGETAKHETIRLRMEPINRSPENILHQKDKIKFIKKVERAVRSSLEYKEYIKYLKDYVDMRNCTYLKGITNRDGKKISIEIHHEPFTLFDLSQIIMDKHIALDEPLRVLTVAEETMKIHFQNLVGLLPLSATVHELVHNGKIFIPLQVLYGSYIGFLEKYDEYITEDLKEVLKTKLLLSKDLSNMDNSVLETRFMYIEIDGVSLPHIVEEKLKAQ